MGNTFLMRIGGYTKKSGKLLAVLQLCVSQEAVLQNLCAVEVEYFARLSGGSDSPPSWIIHL